MTQLQSLLYLVNSESSSHDLFLLLLTNRRLSFFSSFLVAISRRIRECWTPQALGGSNATITLSCATEQCVFLRIAITGLRFQLLLPFSPTYSTTMADSEPRAKRSRFDQTEPEPRRSRFDRRSRSPSARKSDSTRERSPLSRDTKSPAVDDKDKAGSHDPTAAAGECFPASSSRCGNSELLTGILTAAAAAKIKAQIQERQGLQQVASSPQRNVRQRQFSSIYNMGMNGCAELVH